MSSVYSQQAFSRPGGAFLASPVFVPVLLGMFPRSVKVGKAARHALWVATL